jgi:hypothetical protein
MMMMIIIITIIIIIIIFYLPIKSNQWCFSILIIYKFINYYINKNNNIFIIINKSLRS